MKECMQRMKNLGGDSAGTRRSMKELCCDNQETFDEAQLEKFENFGAMQIIKDRINSIIGADQRVNYPHPWADFYATDPATPKKTGKRRRMEHSATAARPAQRVRSGYNTPGLGTAPYAPAG